MLRAVALTALAPILWGLTYLIFTEGLPEGHPLVIGALRGLLGGLVLLALGAGPMPRGQWPKLLTLGIFNMSIFFAFLFVAAARLPGGIAATFGATQPLIVAFIAWPLVGRTPKPLQLAAAAAGVVGVAVLVLAPDARLDLIGSLAAFGGALSMALSTVLIERWGRIAPPLTLTAWQLVLGGLVLLPVALLGEGLPPAPDLRNIAFMAVLVLAGTALAYWLWIRGIGKLGANAAFLMLLTPLTAAIAGAIVLGEWLTPIQLLGAILILCAALAGIVAGRRRTGSA